MGPRSSIMILNPPAVPRPSIGGAAKTVTTASRMCFRHRARIWPAMASPVNFSPTALLERPQHHVHRAEVGSVGPQQQRLARDAHRVLYACDAGKPRRLGLVAAHQPIDVRHHGLGALHRGGIGQLDVDQQIAFILRWNEARRRPCEAPVSEVQEPAVDQQRDEAGPQQEADQPGVHRRADGETHVEELEEPAEARVEKASQDVAFVAVGLEEDGRQGRAQG